MICLLRIFVIFIYKDNLIKLVVLINLNIIYQEHDDTRYFLSYLEL